MNWSLSTDLDEESDITCCDWDTCNSGAVHLWKQELINKKVNAERGNNKESDTFEENKNDASRISSFLSLLIIKLFPFILCNLLNYSV